MNAVAQFWHELRRRRVVRVAIVYIIAAVAVVEVANNFLPALQLPDWTTTLAAALAVLGFPIAIALAWAFDITPRGVMRTEPLPAAAGDGAGAAAATAPPVRASPAPDGPVRSLAVLPFVSMGAEEYFSDGVTEELISVLSRVPGLRVAARTSAFVFKDQVLDVREIGERLGVDAVMEGSVRRFGDRIRINAQLVGAADGWHRWSGSWDYEMDDALRMQEEVSQSVVAALRDAGLDSARPVAITGTSRSGAAWDLYLQGRYFCNRRTDEALVQATTYFEQAVAVDPQYALAHAGIAEALVLRAEYGGLAPRDAVPRATRAAERARVLAPDLAEAIAARALVHTAAWEWNAAEDAFRKALELHPSLAGAWHRYGLLLAWLGQTDDALRTMRRAADTDPLSPVVATGLAWVHYYARRFDDAAAAAAAVIEGDAAFLNAHIVRGLSRLAAGDAAGAVTDFDTAARISGQAPAVLPLLGLAAGGAGDDATARAVLERTRARRRTAWTPAYYSAIAQLGVGDDDAALHDLEEAVNERAVQLAYLRMDPVLDRLRPNPRFRRMLAAVGLD